jgi:hypothetical protein
MADQNEAAKKLYEDEKKRREEHAKATAEQREAVAAAKPTPTQEENDRAACGEHIMEHEPDGSPPGNGPQTKQSEADKRGRGNYQTRAATPAA